VTLLDVHAVLAVIGLKCYVIYFFYNQQKCPFIFHGMEAFFARSCYNHMVIF
jgi:hypothetical protein